MPTGQDRLPRLRDEFYRGYASVHWTFGIEERKTGWLDDGFHTRFREVLVHACARHHCACPVYCLMPDHLHLLLLGTSENRDLRLAATFLRKHLALFLAPAEFQKQAYDHVLREEERCREAFVRICHYILENPVRAGLCTAAAEYSWSGAVIPGFPDLRIHEAGYWDLFWRIAGKDLPWRFFVAILRSGRREAVGEETSRTRRPHGRRYGACNGHLRGGAFPVILIPYVFRARSDLPAPRRPGAGH